MFSNMNGNGTIIKIIGTAIIGLVTTAGGVLWGRTSSNAELIRESEMANGQQDQRIVRLETQMETIDLNVSDIKDDLRDIKKLIENI